MTIQDNSRNWLWGIALLALTCPGCADDDPRSPGDGETGSEVLAGNTGGTTFGSGASGGASNTAGGSTSGSGGSETGGTGTTGSSVEATTTGGGSEGGAAGGLSGAGPGAGAGTTTGDVETRPDQGMGDGQDVITIGDSWMNLGFNDTSQVGIQASLERASGRDYRNYGIGGTTLLAENGIPAQYKRAKNEGPVTTVIMTGGGNDVLQDIALGPLGSLFGQPGCIDEVFNAACQKRIDEVAARLESLWAEMAADGVSDVVIISYTSKALGGNYTMTQTYSTSKITPICLNVPEPLRCSSVETDVAVPDLTLGADGIHPDEASYDKLGAAVWEHMQALGMRR